MPLAVHTGLRLELENDGEGKSQPISLGTQEPNRDDAASHANSYFKKEEGEGGRGEGREGAGKEEEISNEN